MKIDFNKHCQEMLKYPTISKFIKTHQLKSEAINHDLNLFLAVYHDQLQCQDCQGLGNCPKSNKGQVLNLNYLDDMIVTYLSECHYHQEARQKLDQQQNLQVIAGQIPQIDNLFINQERRLVLSLFQRFQEQLKLGQSPIKGIYLYGPYGCGKSYLMAYLAKELAKSGHQVVYGYFPELVWQVKKWQKNNRLDDLIDYLKDIEILIIDDFGGVTLSEFVRDEILLPIFQYRGLKNKITFMTSNLNIDQLLEQLSEGKNNTIDETRAQRLIERIRVLMEIVPLNDRNYR